MPIDDRLSLREAFINASIEVPEIKSLLGKIKSCYRRFREGIKYDKKLSNSICPFCEVGLAKDDEIVDVVWGTPGYGSAKARVYCQKCKREFAHYTHGF